MRKEGLAKSFIYRPSIGSGSRTRVDRDRGGGTRSTAPLFPRIRHGSGHGCGGPRSSRSVPLRSWQVGPTARAPPRLAFLLAEGWVVLGLVSWSWTCVPFSALRGWGPSRAEVATLGVSTCRWIPLCDVLILVLEGGQKGLPSLFDCARRSGRGGGRMHSSRLPCLAHSHTTLQTSVHQKKHICTTQQDRVVRVQIFLRVRCRVPCPYAWST